MLGSAHAGERATAALKAAEFLQERGLVWDDVLIPSSPEPEPPREQQEPDRAPRDWRDLAVSLLRKPSILTDWEVDFLTALNEFPRASAKQLETLRQITKKAERARGRT